MTEAYDGRQVVGMDLHRRRSVLVRMTLDGRKLETARITNSPQALRAVIGRAGECPLVVVEATYGWYWAADLLQELGARVDSDDRSASAKSLEHTVAERARTATQFDDSRSRLDVDRIEQPLGNLGKLLVLNGQSVGGARTPIRRSGVRPQEANSDNRIRMNSRCRPR